MTVLLSHSMILLFFLLILDSANVKLGRTREEQFNFMITVIRRVEASQRIRFVL